MEADGADRDAAVGLPGEEPPVEDPAVGAAVGTGRGAGEKGASGGVRRVRDVRVVDEGHRVLRAAAHEADGQAGSARPGVHRVDEGRVRLARAVDDHAEQPALPGVLVAVEHREREEVVGGGPDVGVEEDARDGLRRFG